MPPLSALQWSVAALCGFFVGVSKTGMPGLAIAVVPLMALAAGEVRAGAGWLLPMLITADIFAVAYWRRHASVRKLFSLAPWVAAGMAGGAFALGWKEQVLRPLVGAIVTVMLAAYLWRRWRPSRYDITPHPAAYGVSAGFATTVANAAGPVMNLYLLSKRLRKEEFIATGAWFFFVINLTKVPIYVTRGIITPKSLLVDVCVLPAVVAGAYAGRRVVPHIPERVFEVFVVAFTIASTVLLLR